MVGVGDGAIYLIGDSFDIITLYHTYRSHQHVTCDSSNQTRAEKKRIV